MQRIKLVFKSQNDRLRRTAPRVRRTHCLAGFALVGGQVILGCGCCIARAALLSSGRYLPESCCGTLPASERFQRSCRIPPYAIVGPHKHSSAVLTTSTCAYAVGNQLGSRSEWSTSSESSFAISDSRAAVAFMHEELPGGHGFVVAGALVTRDTLPYVTETRVPPTVVRFGFERHIVAELANTYWWGPRPNEMKEGAPLPPRSRGPIILEVTQ